ncbi:MAG: hypothetical protein Q4G21_04075 [Dermabacter sp.]|nr:hypothetical protein [Dermabacter sp.]
MSLVSAERVLAAATEVQLGEIANTIVGLINSAYFTGKVIHVDGGAHLI